MTSTSQPRDTVSPPDNTPLNSRSDSDVRQRLLPAENIQANASNQPEPQKEWDPLLLAVRNGNGETFWKLLTIIGCMISFSRRTDSRWELYLAYALSPFVFLLQHHLTESLMKYSIRRIMNLAIILRLGVLFLGFLSIILYYKCWNHEDSAWKNHTMGDILLVGITLVTLLQMNVSFRAIFILGIAYQKSVKGEKVFDVEKPLFGIQKYIDSLQKRLLAYRDELDGKKNSD